MNCSIEKPSLTVAICTYNRAKRLRKMLDSIFAQSRRDFDIIVVDDCSSDETNEYCLSIREERFRYVRNEHNLGFNGNYNKAVSLAETSHVLLTHDDDYMDPGFIDNLFSGINRYPDAILITTNVRIVSDDGKVLHAKAFNLKSDLIYKSGEYAKAMYEKGIGLYCPTFCFKKDLLLQSKISFESVGSGSDLLMTLQANRFGTVVTLADVHFNVCSHALQDHVQVLNSFQAEFDLEIVATPLIIHEPLYRDVIDPAKFKLVYSFGKKVISLLISENKPVKSLKNLVDFLDQISDEMKTLIFSSSRNRILLHLLSINYEEANGKLMSSDEWVKLTGSLSKHLQKWHLHNLRYFDTLERILRDPRFYQTDNLAILHRKKIYFWGFSYISLIMILFLDRLGIKVEGIIDGNPKLSSWYFRQWPCQQFSQLAEELRQGCSDVLIIAGTEGAQYVDMEFEIYKEKLHSEDVRIKTWRDIISMASNEI